MRWALYLDDERHPKTTQHAWNICRSVADAWALMLKTRCPYFVSFDHDLGGGRPDLDGIGLARRMIEKDLDMGGTWIPSDFSFNVHSANPVGAANIKGLLDSYLRSRLHF